MNPVTQDRSELYLRFNRQATLSLLAVIALVGATALTLMLRPSGGTPLIDTLHWWLAPVMVAALILLAIALGRRRWSPHAPEVQATAADEWRRLVMDRAMRWTLIVLLLIQWPLAWLFGFAVDLPAPRGALAMAAATLVLGAAMPLAILLWMDRD